MRNTKRVMVSGFENCAWLARVSSSDDRVIAGAAWAIDCEHLVTCAHVVQDAGALGPGGKVWVHFPVLRVGCVAEVLEDGWAAPRDGGMAGDVALLRLLEPSIGTEGLPARSLHSLDGRDFSTYGFPEGYDSGFNISGTLGKAIPTERVQLEASGAALVQPGFSGSPAWSEGLGAVVGMLTSRHRETAGRVAFAVPVHVVAAYSLIVSAAVQTPLDMDRDRSTHWGPRSRGVSSDRDDAGWLFSGRAHALSELGAWLRDGPVSHLRVLTGTPGTGKSAVLARLVTTADPHYRHRIPELQAADVLPPVGAFDVTFHAKDRTLREFVDHVADLLEIRADHAASLLSALDQQDRGIVIAIDAVDEASEPKELCWLLNDVAARGHRVLAGCRPHLADELNDSHPIRLDQQPYLDNRDIQEYVDRLLLALHDESGVPQRREYSAEIAAAAAGNFLVAQLAAQAVAASGRIERPLPRNVAQAFGRLLDALPDEKKARDLLLPLALSFGDGLPRDLWLDAAATLRRRYQPADLDDLLLSPAASFLITRLAAPEGRRHRLFHHALAETLTTGRDLSADHRRLLETWISSLPEMPGGRRSWATAPAYLCTHVAGHALIAGVLDALIEDPGYLIAADPERLLLALPSLTAPTVRGTRAVYRRVFDALHSSPPAQRASYLEMAARQEGEEALADEIASHALTAPWSARWAHWQQSAEHFVVGRHDGSVRSVSLGKISGQTVALSGSNDRTVRLWDLSSGVQRGRPLTGHAGAVLSVALGEVQGQPIAISGSNDGTIRVWDLSSNAQRGRPLEGHQAPVSAVAFGELAGRPIALSGSDDGTVRIWDLVSLEQHGEPLRGRNGAVLSVAFGRLSHHPIALSGSADGALRIWDLTSGKFRGQSRDRHDGVLWAVAFGELDGRGIALSGGEDRTVRVWDLASGEQRQQPLSRHSGRVAAVALGELYGHVIALSGGHDGTLRIWDLVSGEQRGQALSGEPLYGNAVALGELADKPIAISGSDDGSVRVWDLSEAAKHGERRSGRLWVWAVACGQVDGEAVALSGNDAGEIRVWDLASGEQRGEPLTGHHGAVSSVAFGEVDAHPVVLSGSADATLRVWDFALTGNARDSERADHEGPVRMMSLSEVDRSQVAPERGERNPVRIWDVAPDAQRGELFTGHFAIQAVAFGKLSGQPIGLTGNTRGTLRVWDLATGEQLGEPMTGHDRVVWAVAVGNLNATPVALSGSSDRTVRIWNLDSGTQLGKPLYGHDGTVRAVAFGELDQQPIALSGSDDRTVRVWDLALRTQHGQAFTGHASGVSAVAFGELGGHEIVLSGGDDGTLRAWDLDGKCRLIINLGSAVRALAFRAPSTTLVGANAGLMAIQFLPGALTA